MVPVMAPDNEGESRRGALKRVVLLAEPVPAVMLQVTNPTGSVVAF
jgi:hypothetical protein